MYIIPSSIVSSLLRDGLPNEGVNEGGDRLGLLFGRKTQTINNVLTDGANHETIIVSNVITGYLPLDDNTVPKPFNFNLQSIHTVVSKHQRQINELIGIFAIRANTPMYPSVTERTLLQQLSLSIVKTITPVLLVMTSSGICVSSTLEHPKLSSSICLFEYSQERFNAVKLKVPAVSATIKEYTKFITMCNANASATHVEMLNASYAALASIVEGKLNTIEELMREVEATEEAIRVLRNRV